MIDSFLSPPGGQWYGPSGGVDAAEQGQPSRAKARQAACKWGRRAASLRSGLLFLILDAGNSEQFGLFLLPSPPDLTSSRAGLTRRRRRRGRRRKRQELNARGTVDLNHPSGCSELPEQVGPERHKCLGAGWGSPSPPGSNGGSGSSGDGDGGAVCEWMFGGKTPHLPLASLLLLPRSCLLSV